MFAALLAAIWRLLCEVFDWRAWGRWLMGRPQVDVVIITNVRDEQERYRFWGNRVPAAGHSNGARIYLHGVAGRVRGIYVTAEEMLTKQGRQKAKEQFIEAVNWAEKKGAKVVLLAASTKRLFGRDGTVLKGMFPNMLFTIGDNGTAQLLCMDIDRAFSRANIAVTATRKPRVLVIGPYGILGEVVTQHLYRKQYDVVGFGTNESALQTLSTQFPITLHSDVSLVGEVDAVVACTHSPDAKLSATVVNDLRKYNKKLLVIDVAEPANLDREVYAQVKSILVRQDAGNAYSPALDYVLGSLSSRMLHLPSRVVFGCFAEALSLYRGIYHEHNHQLLQQDWFTVNPVNMALVHNEFLSADIQCPTPVCFGVPVSDFDLQLPAFGEGVQAGGELAQNF